MTKGPSRKVVICGINGLILIRSMTKIDYNLQRVMFLGSNGLELAKIRYIDDLVTKERLYSHSPSGIIISGEENTGGTGSLEESREYRQAHWFIRDWVCTHCQEIFSLQSMIIGRELEIYEGRLDLLVKLPHKLLCLEISCLYNSGKYNQQSGADRALGQLIRYLTGLGETYRQYHGRKVMGIAFLSYIPHKSWDMAKYKDDITIWHPGNNSWARKARHAYDVALAAMNQTYRPYTGITPKDVDVILAYNKAIDLLSDCLREGSDGYKGEDSETLL